jgi:hypothetical protein
MTEFVHLLTYVMRVFFRMSGSVNVYFLSNFYEWLRLKDVMTNSYKSWNKYIKWDLVLKRSSGSEIDF